MPYAITHFLVVVILLELFRDFFIKDRRAFPVYYVFIGGLAGLFPDLDLVIFYVLSFFGYGFDEVHRVFLHNLFIPLFFILLGIVFYGFKSKKLGERHLKFKNICFIIAFGVLIHLILDALVYGEVMLFYPLSRFSIGFNLIWLFPISWQATIVPAIDAGILVIWVSYMVIKHKIRDFW